MDLGGEGEGMVMIMVMVMVMVMVSQREGVERKEGRYP